MAFSDPTFFHTMIHEPRMLKRIFRTMTGQLGGQQCPIQLGGQLRQVAGSAGDPPVKAMNGASVNGNGKESNGYHRTSAAAAPAGAVGTSSLKKPLSEVLADMYRSFMIALCFKSAKPLE